MAKYQSSGNYEEDIRHYQKRLIPLNIVVCILCLISIFTLMFAPFLKIDVSKIVSNPTVKEYVSETLEKSFNGSGNDPKADLTVGFTATKGDTGSGSNPDQGSGSGSGSDSGSNSNDTYTKLIGAIANSVVDPMLNQLGSGNLSFSFSAFSSLKVLIGGEDSFRNEISSLVVDFTDKLMAVVNDMLQDGELVDTIVEVSMPQIIKASIETLSSPESDLPQEAKDKLNALTDQEIDDLVQSVSGLNTKTTPSGFIDKVCELAPDLMLTLMGEELASEDVEKLKTDLTTKLDEQLAKVDPQKKQELENGNFNLETFICVMFSEQLDDIMKNFNKESEPAASAMEGEVTPPETTESGKVYCSFAEILAAMQEGEEGEGGIDVKAEIQKLVDKAVAQLGDDLSMASQIYGLLFAVFAVFMLLWFILFLFALIHIFTKNKRFCMWYVKLLCWIPGIIWLALLLTSMNPVISAVAGLIGADMPVALLGAVFGGISSWGTGISFICYWILWLVSIFWAFPIKHKIRKLKKEAKAAAKA